MLVPGVSVGLDVIEEMALSPAEFEVGEPPRRLMQMLTVELHPGWPDDWLVLERERSRELSLQLIEQLVEWAASTSQKALAIEMAYGALRIDPLRKTTARTLVELHLSSGNCGQATRWFLAIRDRLSASLGIEPSSEFRVLMSSLGGPGQSGDAAS